MRDNYNCIICNTNIPILYQNVSLDSEDALTHNMYNDGIVGEISGGYGSKHDLEFYIICICDKCVDNLLSKDIIEDASIKYLTNEKI